MKRYANFALLYAILAVVFGVACEGLTLYLYYEEATVLSGLMPHYFTLGMTVCLLLLVLQRTFTITEQKLLKPGWALYTIGLNLMGLVLVAQGLVEVFYFTTEEWMDYALLGATGLGYALLGVGIIAMLVAVKKQVKARTGAPAAAKAAPRRPAGATPAAGTPPTPGTPPAAGATPPTKPVTPPPAKPAAPQPAPPQPRQDAPPPQRPATSEQQPQPRPAMRPPVPEQPSAAPVTSVPPVVQNRPLEAPPTPVPPIVQNQPLAAPPTSVPPTMAHSQPPAAPAPAAPVETPAQQAPPASILPTTETPVQQQGGE